MPSIRSVILQDVRNAYAMHAPHVVVPPAIDDALASGEAWVDVGHLLGIHDAAGCERTVADVCRRAATSSLANPLFAAIQRQAMKLLGRRPHTMLRCYPAGHNLAMRGAGMATFTGDEHGGRIEIIGAPVHMIEHGGFRAGVRGSLVGILEQLGWESEVTSTAEGLAFPMRWWREKHEEAIG